MIWEKGKKYYIVGQKGLLKKKEFDEAMKIGFSKLIREVKE